MAEAHKAFSFLVDSIPKWIEDLGGIGQKIAVKEDEVTKVAVPVVPVAPLPKKSGSTETLRDEDKVGSRIELLSAPQPDTAAPVSPFREQESLLAKRKRKTASLISGNMSGPNKYRSRSLIIVYYDSDVQKQFETLVRNIGSGRNLLRKGKMAAKIESLSGLMDDREQNGEFDDPILSKIGYRPSLGPGQYRTAQARAGFGYTPPADGSLDQFDIADKALERAQGFCERGAHQFLRDGNCDVELNSCKECFEEVLKLSEPEVLKYKAKADEEKLRAEKEEQQRRQKEEDEKKGRLLRQQQITDNDAAPADGLLEVDDNSEEEDMEVSLANLRQIRMTSRMTARV
jgi:hypothetical protein